MSITTKGISTRLRELEKNMPGMDASGEEEEQWCDEVIDFVMGVLQAPSSRRTRLLRILGSSCLDGYHHDDLPPRTPSPLPPRATSLTLPAGMNFEDILTPEAQMSYRKKEYEKRVESRKKFFALFRSLIEKKPARDASDGDIFQYRGTVTNFKTLTITGNVKSERFNMTEMFYLWKFLSECHREGRKPSHGEVEKHIREEEAGASLKKAFESLIQKLCKVSGEPRKNITSWFTITQGNFFLTKENSPHKN